VHLGPWPSGLYFVRLESADRLSGFAPFVIRPRRLGEHRVAVVMRRPSSPATCWNGQSCGAISADRTGALIGVQYRGSGGGHQKAPWIIRNAPAGDWFFAGTGLHQGSKLGEGSVEIDRTFPASPKNVQVLAEIPNLLGPGFTTQMTYYDTDGGQVFAAGAFRLLQEPLISQISCLLDNLWFHLAERLPARRVRPWFRWSSAASVESEPSASAERLARMAAETTGSCSRSFVALRGAGGQRVDAGTRGGGCFAQVLVNEGDRHAAFADCGGDALDRA
jgi:hypothetical protein